MRTRAVVLKLSSLVVSRLLLQKGKENVHRVKARNGAVVGVLDPWRRVFSSKKWTADDEPTPENRGPAGQRRTTEPSWA